MNAHEAAATIKAALIEKGWTLTKFESEGHPLRYAYKRLSQIAGGGPENGLSDEKMQEFADLAGLGEIEVETSKVYTLKKKD